VQHLAGERRQIAQQRGDAEHGRAPLAQGALGCLVEDVA
jgi:hypothetical protein